MKLEEIGERLARIESLLAENRPRPMTLPEAAEYLRVSRSYLYRMTSGGLIAHFKSKGGKKISFDKGDLDGWLTTHRVKTREEVAAEVDRD